MGAIQKEPLPLDKPMDGKCDCAWGQNDCPNEANYIVVNLGNPGFAAMCQPHAEGWQQDFGFLGQTEVKPYSLGLLAELTTRAKDAGLI